MKERFKNSFTLEKGSYHNLPRINHKTSESLVRRVKFDRIKQVYKNYDHDRLMEMKQSSLRSEPSAWESDDFIAADRAYSQDPSAKPTLTDQSHSSQDKSRITADSFRSLMARLKNSTIESTKTLSTQEATPALPLAQPDVKEELSLLLRDQPETAEPQTAGLGTALISNEVSEPETQAEVETQAEATELLRAETIAQEAGAHAQLDSHGPTAADDHPLPETAVGAERDEWGPVEALAHTVKSHEADEPESLSHQPDLAHDEIVPHKPVNSTIAEELPDLIELSRELLPQPLPPDILTKADDHSNHSDPGLEQGELTELQPAPLFEAIEPSSDHDYSSEAQLADWQEIEDEKPENITQPMQSVVELQPLPSTPRHETVHPDENALDIVEVSKAVYATPTFAERSAFLVEVAAHMMAEEQKEKQEKSVKPVAPGDDNPFSAIALSSLNVSSAVEEEEDSGELALSLLDMMLSGPNSGQPQERTLAADALLKIMPRTPLKAMISITNRLAIMESPPPLLVTRLINDPRIEVSGPLLENCNHISDDILARTIASGQVSLQRLIARRRQVSSALTDQLLTFGDTSVVLTLIRNSGAVFSHQGFLRLSHHAAQHPLELAPLSTRSDLPAPIAFELFWFVPSELRRYILSRFLTDSETLTKILKITQVMQASEQMQDAKLSASQDTEEFLELLQQGNFERAADKLAEIANIHVKNAARIISDRSGEPLAIVLKALGLSRSRFEAVINDLKASSLGIILPDRHASELQSTFEQMSFNKVRVLLTYWDWAVQQAGPYAPAH